MGHEIFLATLAGLELGTPAIARRELSFRGSGE